MRRLFLICLLGLAALLCPSAALAAAPAVTLSDPANGALITGSQPTFSGAAVDSPAATGSVTIDLYSGSSTGGVPVQIIGAQVLNGAYSAQPVLPLSDGEYTVVASEGDGAGNTGTSQTVSFDVFNGSPSVTLAAPGATIKTPAPSFSGTASTAPGASQTVDMVVYPGTGTDTTPAAVFAGAVQASGAFSIQALPGLANGTYTAYASQQLPFGTGFSTPVHFQIATPPPALTVTAPAASATDAQTGVSFSGGAGNAWGDGAQVNLTLYRGAKASGTALGSAAVNRSAGSWHYQWGSTLALGTYTLVANQTDVVGLSTTVTRTFKVAAPGQVTGGVRISKAGRLTATLSCLDGAGTCNGDVLILTRASFRAQPGGPAGPLSLMFKRYSVPAGKRVTLTAKLTGAQRRALRRVRSARLVVTVAYSVGSELTETKRTTAPVKLG